MVQKRPFVEDFSNVSSKHSKLEHGCQLVPFLEFPFHNVSHDRYTADLGKGSFSKCTTESHVKHESGKIIVFPSCTENDILPGEDSNSSWPSSCVSEEDVRPEGLNYSPDSPRRVIKQPEDAYSYLMQCPPQKPVLIGPDFQADIPECCGHDPKNVSPCSDFAEALASPQALESNFKSYAEDDIKHLGQCIIPLPETEPVSCNSDNVGCGRTDCFCEDPGSVQCVRQHVGEARLNLRRSVGLERFLELGFSDMGETVADKWSDLDEELFHDVVFSNPASLGKNFWHHLAAVFTSRISFEIVSYYFNVFMLRKRADQNRCTPTNIDSDNDEWEGRDQNRCTPTNIDSDNDEWEGRDESEEDDDPYQNEIYVDDSYKGMTNVSERWPMNLLNNSSSNSSSQCSDKTIGSEMGAYDFQEDSNTTFDAVSVPQISQEKVEDGKHGGNGEFISERCDANVWDTEYSTFPRTKADFLPTYSMIEEVFGVEEWEQGSGDDDGNSLS